MADQAQKQRQLSDSMLTEVWTVMHLAMDVNPANENIKVAKPHRGPVISFEGAVEELESDSPFDGNANEDNVDDIQALKEAADTLAIIGDQYGSKYSKEEEDKLVGDIVKFILVRAPDIDKKLEQKLESSKPSQEIFEIGLMDLAYREVSSRLETFLVGSEGLNTIAVVTHVTKGVSAALRDVSQPAVGLAAALSFKFVTEKFSNLLIEHGGLRNLVSKSKD